VPVTTLRAPWSGGDLATSADHLQFRRRTAAQLAAENPLLLPGEPCWEIDTNKGKVGDGTHRYNALTYSFGVATSGGAMTLAASSIAGNNTGASGPATSLDAATARGLLDVVRKTGAGNYDDHVVTYDAHVAASGTKTPQTATVTTTNGSDLVTSTTALPSDFINGTPVAGPGIGSYAFVSNMAGDRKSFRLSSNWLSFVSMPAGAGAGTGTATARPIWDTAHGLKLNGIWAQDPLTNRVQGYSGISPLGNTLTTAMLWEVSWYRGELWAHSFEYPTAQRLFPFDTYTPIRSHIVVPVPSALQSWASFPTSTPAAMFGDTTGRYNVQLALEQSTQARIIVDWMGTGATAGSGAKLKAQYWNGSAFVDLAENSPASTIEVSLDAGNNVARVGNWGAIDDAAKTFAASNGDMLLIRLVGFAASAAGTPTFGTVRIQFKP